MCRFTQFNVDSHRIIVLRVLELSRRGRSQNAIAAFLNAFVDRSPRFECDWRCRYRRSRSSEPEPAAHLGHWHTTTHRAFDGPRGVRPAPSDAGVVAPRSAGETPSGRQKMNGLDDGTDRT
jgi:hypothetical protein